MFSPISCNYILNINARENSEEKKVGYDGWSAVSPRRTWRL